MECVVKRTSQVTSQVDVINVYDIVKIRMKTLD